MRDVAAGHRLVYVAADDLEQWHCRPIGAIPVLDLKDRRVGAIEGLIIETPSEQPRYLVIGREHTTGRESFLVPVNDGWFDQTARAVRIDAARGEVPRIEREQFERMSPDEAEAFEWQVLKQCCPEVAVTDREAPDYDASKSFACPPWIRDQS